VSRLALAIRYLTILPVPGPAVHGLQALGAAAAWFPLVGLGLGLGLAVLAAVLGRLFPPLLAALLTVTVWKLLTGGLHLDGLADCLDGLVGRDAEHRLAIMRDSRIGAFGAVGLILFLMLEITALGELPVPARWEALIAAPVIARAVPPLLGRLFGAARPDGMGAAFRAGLGRSAAPTALATALAVAAVALGWPGIVAMAAALVAAVGLGRFMSARLGGLTGDVLGAAVEISELTVLLVVSAWSYARP
jgi:adenosylcobinamide-GDP ribazoletransferase